MLICPHCNQPIQPGQPWVQCPGCGHYAHQACWEQRKGCAVPGCSYQTQAAAMPAQQPAPQQPTAPKKPLPKPLILGVAVALILLIAGIIFLTTRNPAPKVSPQQVQNILDVGMYPEAMELATPEQEQQVLWENLIAYVSRDVPGYLSNPTSFTLQRAWVNQQDKQALLYGTADGISQYWVFTYDPDARRYPLTANLKDPNANPQDEAWAIIQPMMAHADWQLDTARVQQIDQLRKDGGLFTMTLLDVWRP